jgi:cell division protein FtsZ
VLAFATLPFSFEGKRRNAQAREALARFNEVANAVVCFENDQMGDIVPPQAGIHQAFAVADSTISQSVRSIVNLIQRPGLIHIGFDDLLAALRSRNGRCLFGFGESDSDNRAHEALTQALKNPLMDRGRMLEEAGRVLVQVAGGPGMTLSEVEVLMQELGRHVSEQTHILFGAAVDARLGDRLTVTIISSLTADEDLIPQQTQPALSSAPAKLPVWEQPQEIPPQLEIEPEPTPMEVSEPADMIPLEAPPPPVEPVLSNPEPIVSPAHKTPVKEAKPSAEKSVQAKQEVLQFEAVTRGRFEKSEPTIVEGEDLDVPTYLRKNIKVK